MTTRSIGGAETPAVPALPEEPGGGVAGGDPDPGGPRFPGGLAEGGGVGGGGGGTGGGFGAGGIGAARFGSSVRPVPRNFDLTQSIAALTRLPKPSLPRSRGGGGRSEVGSGDGAGGAFVAKSTGGPSSSRRIVPLFHPAVSINSRTTSTSRRMSPTQKLNFEARGVFNNAGGLANRSGTMNLSSSVRGSSCNQRRVANASSAVSLSFPPDRNAASALNSISNGIQFPSRR